MLRFVKKRVKILTETENPRNKLFNLEIRKNVKKFLEPAMFCHLDVLIYTENVYRELQGNRSAGILNLWGLHVYPQYR